MKRVVFVLFVVLTIVSVSSAYTRVDLALDVGIPAQDVDYAEHVGYATTWWFTVLEASNCAGAVLCHDGDDWYHYDGFPLANTQFGVPAADTDPAELEFILDISDVNGGTATVFYESSDQ